MGHFETRVEPALTALASLRHSLDAWLEGGGMGEPPRAAVVLATHEAVANAIQHAGARVPSWFAETPTRTASSSR